MVSSLQKTGLTCLLAASGFSAVLAQDTPATAKAHRGVAVSVAVGVNIQAQQPASDRASPTPVRQDSRSLEERIELAKLRVAIRLQEVEIAKAEHRLLLSKLESRDDLKKSAARDLQRMEEELQRVTALFKEGNVSQQRVQEAQAMLASVRAKHDAYLASKQAESVEVSVNEERIRLLVLRAELEQTKLRQLQNRLK